MTNQPLKCLRALSRGIAETKRAYTEFNEACEILGRYVLPAPDCRLSREQAEWEYRVYFCAQNTGRSHDVMARGLARIRRLSNAYPISPEDMFLEWAWRLQSGCWGRKVSPSRVTAILRRWSL